MLSRAVTAGQTRRELLRAEGLRDALGTGLVDRPARGQQSSPLVFVGYCNLNFSLWFWKLCCSGKNLHQHCLSCSGFDLSWDQHCDSPTAWVSWRQPLERSGSLYRQGRVLP